MNHRENAGRIFLDGVRSVLPENLITGRLSLSGTLLTVNSRSFDLRDHGNIYVIGAGKASAAMAHYTEVVLGDRITGGVVVVKYGHSCKLRRIKVIEAGHPVPDENGFMASGEILRIAGLATEKDIVICLLSGGGSALMADLPGGLLPEELYIVNNLLIRCGASINEINCVRKHLSGIKGGQLSRAVWPALCFSYILSDVTGDPLDVIASGPTVPDPTTFQDALKIIDRYNLEPDLTAGVLRYIRDGAEGVHPETPKEGDPVFSKTYNILAGTNHIALEACLKTATELGYIASIPDRAIQGDVESVCENIIRIAEDYKSNPDAKKPTCLLFGGEPTIRIEGNGKGGRNQHLALLAALRIKDIPGITFLSAGTDGSDGPTDAAGAVVDSETARSAAGLNKDPEKYLSDFDSYNFFKGTEAHIITGPTFTNVMDLIIVIVD